MSDSRRIRAWLKLEATMLAGPKTDQQLPLASQCGSAVGCMLALKTENES